MSVLRWGFYTGLLNGLLLWMREHMRKEELRKQRKFHKRRLKEERARQPLYAEADSVRRH